MKHIATGHPISIDNLELPPVLYKFREFTNKFHRAALYDGELYTPSANEFNDPYDSNTPFRYKEEELTETNIYLKLKLLGKSEFPDKEDSFYEEFAYKAQRDGIFLDQAHLDKVDEKIFENVCNTFGILSLTPDCFNIPMWAYYGCSHKGFCIGYDSKRLASSGIFGMGGKVRYSKGLPKVSLFDYSDGLTKMFYVKSKVWKHENEYRLLHPFQHGKIHKIDKLCIKEVILGSKVALDERLKLVEKIIKELPHANIYQMELDKNVFGLKKTTVFDSSFVLQ
jgi:hypothetical protein